MQHSTSPYDDLARLPRALAGKGSHRRKAASRHRRHSPARFSCRMVAPIRNARFVDLILAAIIASQHRPAPATGSGVACRKLENDPPHPRPTDLASIAVAVQRTGVVVAIPILSALHHHYVRI